MHTYTHARSVAWRGLIRCFAVCAAVAACAVLAGLPAHAADKKAVAPREAATDAAEAKRARELLGRAVAYYKEKKQLALAAFNRQGEFISGDLYVYAIDAKTGTFLASGGSSFVLIDQVVTNMPDVTGKRFFKEMLDTAAAKGAGTVEYRWLNRVDRTVQRKVAHFEKVGDTIIAVGYYIPHATPEQAREMLKRAAEAVASDPARAFAEFNNLQGKFIEDDLYVFAVNMDDGRIKAHGAIPRLVNTDGFQVVDPDGKPIIKQMVALVKAKGQGEIDYTWRNTVTNKVEKKHSYLRKVNNYLVGVGYYTD